MAARSGSPARKRIGGASATTPATRSGWRPAATSARSAPWLWPTRKAAGWPVAARMASSAAGRSCVEVVVERPAARRAGGGARVAVAAQVERPGVEAGRGEVAAREWPATGKSSASRFCAMPWRRRTGGRRARAVPDRAPDGGRRPGRQPAPGPAGGAPGRAASHRGSGPGGAPAPAPARPSFQRQKSQWATVAAARSARASADPADGAEGLEQAARRHLTGGAAAPEARGA